MEIIIKKVEPCEVNLAPDDTLNVEIGITNKHKIFSKCFFKLVGEQKGFGVLFLEDF